MCYQIGFNVSAIPSLMLLFPNLVSNPLLYPKTLHDRYLLTKNFLSCYPCRKRSLYEGMSERSQHLEGVVIAPTPAASRSMVGMLRWDFPLAQ